MEEKELEALLYEGSGVAAAIKAGMDLSSVQKIELSEGEKTRVVVKDGFKIETIDNHRERPVCKKGSRTFTAAKSFCSYVNKHKSDDETIIIADEDQGQIKAILNDHGEYNPAWGDFTAVFDLGFSKQWKTWSKNAETRMSQEDFAEFIDQNRTDLMVGEIDLDGEPFKNVSPLELKSLILDLRTTWEQKFSSKLDPVTGATNLSYVDEEKGKGSVTIPDKFVIAIPIYNAGDIFMVRIELRLRTRDGKAFFYYFIDQVEKLKEAAFDKICQRIEKGNVGSEEKEDLQFSGTGIEVFKGKL